MRTKDLRIKEADGSIKRVPVKVGAELQVCSWSHFCHVVRFGYNLLYFVHCRLYSTRAWPEYFGFTILC